MSNSPADANARRAIPPVICYPDDTLPAPDVAAYLDAFEGYVKVDEVTVPPRDARCFRVPAGGVFRITSVEAPQVGDLNLWHADNLDERFFSGKTRALHGTHVTTGNRLWSSLPYLRPLATIIEDTLSWYGFDAFGGAVHDVIGTRCDPYTGRLLSGDDYHYCCHSNLTRALADTLDVSVADAERHVHDVLNVFMCTGFTRDTGQYFMKASPVRPGDHLTFFAEAPLLGALSACPGGDCGSTHSSDDARCAPLLVEVFKGDPPSGWSPAEASAYPRTHGV
ncbi:MAG: urea carboxylase-associated family protein [Paracoccaceae bacterium]